MYPNRQPRRSIWDVITGFFRGGRSKVMPYTTLTISNAPPMFQQSPFMTPDVSRHAYGQSKPTSMRGDVYVPSPRTTEGYFPRPSRMGQSSVAPAPLTAEQKMRLSQMPTGPMQQRPVKGQSSSVQRKNKVMPL